MAERITLDSAYKYGITTRWTDGKDISTSYVITETGEPVYNWYMGTYPGWYMVYPGYAGWTHQQFIDTTKKAMEIAKDLMDRKLVTMKNVKDFIDFVDIIRKRLDKTS